MRPTLRQLQYLVAIAETGKFGDAAKRTNVSQPSLSAQIADMEEYLGSVLIERGRHGALLTPLGEEAVRRARLILRDVEDLKAVLSADGQALTGRIRLGVLPTIGPYLLPGVTRHLHAEYPDFRLSVREERTIDLETHLHDGQFDTIISTAEDHENEERTHLFEESLWVCAAPDDPIAQSAGDVRLADLKGCQLISLGHGDRLSHRIQTIAEAAGAHVSSEYEGTSLDAIRQMAEMGAGVAVFPSLYALTEARRDPDLVVRRIDDPLARRDISLIWRRTSPLKDRLLKLAEELRAGAASILLGRR
ncbi:MAG: LysR family transcriptional regulator [Henriciella sp.]|jgi:LysR family hydrogen peroxide-inducible transcriptional activator|uniref:hydrogen peroxide-inducible genes activator n=1 Tax=Henriciella sp. TaxID=1968823 RepID=UPI000C0CC2BD|nr:hydrogen peroxide-inducible genes activator [Henriciella sp.]MAN74718.1 LysR family transcriptional regulator [Henriciella sp.]MBF32879.1 LysR family transcriptional regulator [Hyphomonadaceae bacterium]PHR78362.1 MAG: LysR family transcriptional regulator [Henriciella sp.]|tara:strand:+ start:384 stop:1298 length:915 start_codon:yes stop_codon:yes gene_type:complete